MQTVRFLFSAGKEPRCLSKIRRRPLRGPLNFPVFRALWIATIISNIGTWMHDVGAAWLMTSLSPSPLFVALVQAATTLPMFLLALPAGAMADIVDRRKMLLAAQILGLAAAAVLAVLTSQGLTTPWVLLGATFVLGVAAALSAPVFQAIVPELVDKPALPDAVALNSLGVNISRAIGPALGGVIVAVAGIPAVFALNAVSVLAVLIVLVTWKRAADCSAACHLNISSARFGPAIAMRGIPRRCGWFWSAPWASSCSAARSGRCCHWWAGENLGWMRPAMARFWAAWARAPSSVHCF